jgi:NodT family efflux transporter outer membrane factor (OMF) lipoprotein
MNKLWPSLMAAWLAGCTVGPDYRAPDSAAGSGYDLAELPAREKVQAAGPVLTREGLPPDWWRLFGNPTLDETEQTALAANNSIAAARATLRQAEESLQAANAVLWPQADVSAGAQRNNAAKSFSAGPSLSYMLDLFGANRRAIEQSEAQTDYQRTQLAAARLTVAGGVATQALAIAGVDLQITVAEEILATDQQTQSMVEKQFAQGKATRADILTAQSQLLSDRSQLAQLRQQLSVARHALAILLGRTPAEWQPRSFTIADFDMPERIPLSLPSEWIHRRPDILAAEKQLHAATAAVGIATAQLYPQVTLSASASRSWTDGGASTLWNAGAGLTAPIFHGGALSAQKAAAEQALEAQWANYRQTVLTAFGQVADSLRALDHDAEQVHDAKASFAVAQQSLALQQASFRAGKTSLLQLLTAQRAFAQARQSEASARTQQLQDAVQFFLATAGETE